MSVVIPATKPCPFCGAGAEVDWIVHEKWGKSLRIRCSRDGECPSPEWTEAVSHIGTDQECAESVTGFWNTRAEDWIDGWRRPGGAKPKGPVLVFTVARAAERRLAEAIGVPFENAPDSRYALARWRKGQWRDIRDGRIYRVVAWRALTPPAWGPQT